MPYKQLRDANMSTGYTGGWCLKFVQDSFGTDHVYPSAIDAWNANYGNGNHPNELPPSGKTVPVYFSLGNVPAGHVAISLDGGMVASSTQSGYHSSPYFHPNLNNLITVYGRYNGGCNYLGWSEYVGTVRVIENINNNQPAQGDDMIDQGTLTLLFNSYLGRNPDSDAISHYVGKYSTSFVVSDVYNSSEANSYRNNIANEKQSLNNKVDSLSKQINDLNNKVNDLNTKLAGSTNNESDLNSKIAKLTEDNNTLQEKITELNNKPNTDNKSLNDYTFGELLSSAFKKLLNIK